MVITRLWNNLDEFNMHESEIKINAEIDILKYEGNKIIVIVFLKKSVTELWDLHTEKKWDIVCVKKLGYECEEFISVKILKTRK